MRTHLFFITAVLIGLLMGCSSDDNSADADYILTYATPYPSSHPFSLADQEWMDAVVEQSQGRIAFKPYWGGPVLNADMSMLEIRHGVADIGLISPIYVKGGTHLIRTQAGFYGGVRSIEDQVSVYNCLAEAFPQFDRELEGLVVLAVQGGNLPAIITRDKPITSLEDFRGMRLRAPAEMVEVLRQVGADPVNMPMGEVYSALAKGVIDGVVAPGDTFYSLRFSEVADHFTNIRFSRGGYPARAMSEKTWNNLPPELQEIIVGNRDIWEAALSRLLKIAETRGLEFGQENGIQFHDFPFQEQQEFDELYNAAALQQALSIANIGIDAEPVFRTAQQILAAGSPIDCENGSQ
jgi:TRAP-type transport system periplasmic protein